MNPQPHWLMRKTSIRKLWIGFAIVLALTVVPDFFLHPHASFGIDGTPGFFAWYGLLTCAAMVVLAKVMGIFLKRRDDYYDAGE